MSVSLSDREIRGCEYANIDCFSLVLHILFLYLVKLHRHQISIRCEGLVKRVVTRSVWVNMVPPLFFLYTHFIAYLNMEEKKRFTNNRNRMIYDAIKTADWQQILFELLTQN